VRRLTQSPKLVFFGRGMDLFASALAILTALPVLLSYVGSVTTVHADEPVQDTGKQLIQAAGGKYQITIDTSETPDLKDWATTNLAPVVKEWYPKLVEMLPSENYQAPTNVTITFSKDMRGVAATGGTRIRCAATWFRNNLNGEAKGAVVHELIHVVQNYGLGRRNNPNAARTPGWIVEGIPDYIRWFIYEPESKGAEITKRNFERARYDANYRISANFINWVVHKYDSKIVQKINAAAREGKYSDSLWKEYTGKTVQELGDEWRKMHEEKLGISVPEKLCETDFEERGRPGRSDAVPRWTFNFKG
jgi:hypothetical protein